VIVKGVRDLRAVAESERDTAFGMVGGFCDGEWGAANLRLFALMIASGADTRGWSIRHSLCEGGVALRLPPHSKIALRHAEGFFA
jgi:hypothetical protein